MDYKAVPFEITEVKDRGDAWSFTGYASTFGNIDLGGDIVMPGAFVKSLESRKPKLLWQHEIGEPIGRVTSLKENERGLLGEFKLSKTTRGTDAYQLLKDGALDSLSIGFIPTDADVKDNGIRELKSVDLLEISVVSLPMNEQALIMAVKANLPLAAQADRLLEDLRAFTARYRDLADLRARDGRQPGEAVRRCIADLKALAAELIVPEPVAPAAEPPTQGLHSTVARLELARRRLRHAGLLEHAS